MFCAASVQPGATDRPPYLLVGPPFFLGMRLLFGFGPFILEAFGAVLYVSLSALLGFSHDLRKAEGLPG